MRSTRSRPIRAIAQAAPDTHARGIALFFLVGLLTAFAALLVAAPPGVGGERLALAAVLAFVLIGALSLSMAMACGAFRDVNTRGGRR